MHIPKLTMDVLNGIAQFQAEAEDLNTEDSKDKEMVCDLLKTLKFNIRIQIELILGIS